MKTRLKAQETAKNGKRTIDMQLLALYSACLKNAGDLLKESRLLLAHGHHARAYFLAYTAMEELGKSQVVADFFHDLVAESEFKAAFRDHKFKAAYVNRYVEIPPNWENDEWFIIYDAKSSNDHVLARENSLYVESRPDHSPHVPIEVISSESAEKLLSTADKYLSEIHKMEYITEQIGTKAFTK